MHDHVRVHLRERERERERVRVRERAHALLFARTCVNAYGVGAYTLAVCVHVGLGVSVRMCVWVRMSVHVSGVGFHWARDVGYHWVRVVLVTVG